MPQNSSNEFSLRAPIDTGMFNRVRSPLKQVNGSTNNYFSSKAVNINRSSGSFDQRSSWGMTPGGSPRN